MRCSGVLGRAETVAPAKVGHAATVLPTSSPSLTLQSVSFQSSISWGSVGAARAIFLTAMKYSTVHSDIPDFTMHYIRRTLCTRLRTAMENLLIKMSSFILMHLHSFLMSEGALCSDMHWANFLPHISSHCSCEILH